jgi:anti-anti-sigma factor
MKLTYQGETLNITDLEELSARNSTLLQSKVAALLNAVKQVQIDLSGTTFVDCQGLGALLAIEHHARAVSPGATLTVLNPRQSVRRMFELTGIERVLLEKTRGPRAPMETVNSRSIAVITPDAITPPGSSSITPIA